jgi:hypothetical protein
MSVGLLGQEAPPAAIEPRAMEDVFVEEGTLRLQVLRETIELATPYGRLAVPFRDVQRIDFGRRLPAEISQ